MSQFNGSDKIINTMVGAVPISDWRLPNGTKINAKDETAAKSSDFISILSNKSYPFVSRSYAFPTVNVSDWTYPAAAPTTSFARQRRKHSMKRPLKSQINPSVVGGQDHHLSVHGEQTTILGNDADRSGNQDSSTGSSLGGTSSAGLSTFTIMGGTFAMVLLILFQCSLWRSIPSSPTHRSLYHQR